ncbi:MAG: ISAs1 family transposase [Terracidiphilus sp.]
MANPLQYFAELTDPRVERTRRHHLADILFIAIAAILCGAGSWDEMERFGKAKKPWLKSFLLLPHGIPSHDTFNRLFQSLAPEELESSFIDWVSSIAQRTQGEVVAIDGKSLRGTRSTDGKSIVHMVSAWAGANNLVLGQCKVDAKSNEITAIPELLRVLELTGATVTIDAIGCQKQIASQIVQQKGDYLLAVKENQPTLLADIRDSFQMLTADSVDEQIDCGHGRVETRRCSVLGDLTLLDNSGRWDSLRSIVRLEATRFHKATGKEEHETRYYISSIEPDAARINTAIRQHWGIENKLHWVLDVAFGEDLSRKRAGNAAQNFSLINRIALNLLRQDKSSRLGIHGKRLAAAWDHDYLLKLLEGSI